MISLLKPLLILPLLLLAGSVASESADTTDQPPQTIKEIMNNVIAPTTAIIWGASELKTDTEWQAVENAALGVIAAGNLLTTGSADEDTRNKASEADWQNYNSQMIAAARQVLTAVQARDEEALFTVGNDALYPPCESCHQKYQAR